MRGGSEKVGERGGTGRKGGSFWRGGEKLREKHEDWEGGKTAGSFIWKWGEHA